MNENLQKFFEKLEVDAELKEKMALCKSEEEAYQLALQTQDGFTKEEFKDAMEKIQKASADTELSVDDLEGVAGGFDLETTTWIKIGIGIGAPAAAAAM